MNTKKTKEELHYYAWNLLEEKGLKISEIVRVRSAFVELSGYEYKNPFIESYFDSEGVRLYHSTHELIKRFHFNTENEVVLANAIYLNIDKDCSCNEFRDMFKFTCRVIGLKSEWS